MNLIIDIGNTVAKIAVFKDKDIVEILYDSNQTLECLSDICAKYAVEKAIVATVIDLNERVSAQLKSLPVSLLRLNEKHCFRWRIFTKRPKPWDMTGWRLWWAHTNSFPARIFWL